MQSVDCKPDHCKRVEASGVARGDSGAANLEDAYNPSTWMLEVIVGEGDFVEIFKGNEVFHHLQVSVALPLPDLLALEFDHQASREQLDTCGIPGQAFL